MASKDSTDGTTPETEKAVRAVAEVGGVRSSDDPVPDLWSGEPAEERRDATCSAGEKRREGRGDGPRGLPAPDKVRQLQITLYRKAQSKPDYRFWSLYGEVQRADVLAWSAAHPFGRGMPDRVREFRHWKTTPGTVFNPRSAHGADAAAALVSVPRPLRAVLELAALERAEHVVIVTAYLRGCGFSADVAHVALRRWLYPVKRTGSLGDAARRARVRKGVFGQQVREAVRRLRGWQHRASVAFLDAFAAQPADVPDVAPKQRKSLRLSKPRFWRGCWDTTQRPGALIVILGNQLHPQEGVIGRDESRRHVIDASRRRAA